MGSPDQVLIERLARIEATIEAKFEALDQVPAELAMLREALAHQSPLSAQVRQLDEDVREIRTEQREQNKKLTWIILGLVLSLGGGGAGLLAKVF